MKITEVSISWHLKEDAKPVAPVDSKVILMIDPRGRDVERAVSSWHVQNLPDWMLRPRTKNLRFVYESPLQNIDCLYNCKTGVFTCSKIKYGNLNELERRGHLRRIFDVIGATPELPAYTRYKASGRVHLDGTPWSREVFADVVTNDPNVARVMALAGTSVDYREARACFRW